MGIFDKINKMVGKTDVKLEFIWLETPFTFTDPMIKATILVKAAGDEVTVIGTTGSFVARRVNDDGKDEEIVLGEKTEVGHEYYHTTRNGKSVPVYPYTIATGGAERFGFDVDKKGGLNLKESLTEWGVYNAESAKNKNVRFFFIGKVNIKETLGMFDPKLEHEIEVR